MGEIIANERQHPELDRRHAHDQVDGEAEREIMMEEWVSRNKTLECANPQCMEMHVLFQSVIDRQEETIASLRQAAEIDPITKLPNRRRFDSDSKTLEVKLENGEISTLCAIIIDLDRFKVVNDTYGHAFGDRVLAKVGGRVQYFHRNLIITAGRTRGARRGLYDPKVGRTGGEELAILIPNVQVDPCEAVKPLLKSIRSIRFKEEEYSRVRITASIGVAITTRGGLTLAELLKKADDAMYAAKHRGRNQVVVADS